MEVREAILDFEKQEIKHFLARFDLEMATDLDKSFYLVDNDKIIGTISSSNYIIKCLAVDPNYQSENISATLIDKILDYFHSINIYSYLVYTKPQYQIIFKSYGFHKLVETDHVVVLEGGASLIKDELKKIKTNLELTFGTISDDSDIASLVINANPMTIGHEYLIEEASLKHKHVVVFVLEEDKSEFSFKERFSMVYLATRKFKNVCIIPSSRYIISKATFPTYFLKDKSLVNQEYAMVDALIFRDYFMKELNISVRYVGTETNERMNNYNETLKKVLGDKLIILDRIKHQDEIVSASKLRQLLKDGLIEETYKYIPNENMFVYRGIISDERYKKW